MASISVSGTGSAALIPVWAILGRRLGAALIIVGMLPAAAPSTTQVDVTFESVRNAKGLIRACLTRDPLHFPHCDADPAARKLSIPAAAGAKLSFHDVAPGDYAISALHDENRDGKLNTRIGIPREGFGFSNNPVVRMSAPKFKAARFVVGAAAVSETIRLQYFL
jgi:uncharacterized protein (DUF2141 family)